MGIGFRAANCFWRMDLLLAMLWILIELVKPQYKHYEQKPSVFD